MRVKERLLCEKAKKAAKARFQLQGLVLERAQGLKPLEQGAWDSYSEDPYFLMRVKEKAMHGVSVTFSMPEQCGESSCYLYYGYEEEGAEIFPENRIRLSLECCEKGTTILFDRPVSALRLDPAEQPGRFVLEGVCISVLQDVPLSPQKPPRDFFVCSAEYGLSKLEQQVKKGKLDGEKTVLFITHEMTKTGAPQLCAALAEEFVRRGYTAVVLSLQRYKELYDRFEEQAEWIFFAQTETERAQIINGLAAMGVHRALCNTVVSGCCAELLSQNHFYNLTLVHEMEISSRLNAGEEQLAQIAAYADHIIFPARIVAREFFGLLGETQAAGKCEILPQGLYKKIGQLPDKAGCARWLRERYGFSDESRIVLCAGTQGIIKGTDLIPFLARLLREAQIHFLWLGNCSDRLFWHTMQKELRKMGLTERVRFEEYVSDAADYTKAMAGADVFLLPSREDSYPSVLLEAMACGTVAIAFEGGGGAQELLDENRGVLVPFLDLEQMALTIRDVAEHPQKYEPMRQAALGYVRQRSGFETYAQRIMEILF